MTVPQMINQLLLLHDGAYDERQKEALLFAVLQLRDKKDLYDRIYMNGFRDGRLKGEST